MPLAPIHQGLPLLVPRPQFHQPGKHLQPLADQQPQITPVVFYDHVDRIIAVRCRWLHQSHAGPDPWC